MKKSVIGILTICLVANVSLTSCAIVDKFYPSRKQATSDNIEYVQETQIVATPQATISLKQNAYYDFPEKAEDDLATMIYVGYGKDERDSNVEKLLKKHDMKKDLLEEVVDQEESEWYTIIPKYEGTKITVDHVELSEEGEMKVTNTLTTTEAPILLGCNFSDIFPSVQVTIEHGEDKIVFSPFLSLEDGDIQEVERVYTKKMGM